jgi:hypothetical protein
MGVGTASYGFFSGPLPWTHAVSAAEGEGDEEIGLEVLF